MTKLSACMGPLVFVVLTAYGCGENPTEVPMPGLDASRSGGGHYRSDNGKIVFASEGDIWVMNADGSQARNLTEDPAHFDDTPAWSPNGRRIVFSRDGDIYVMRADGDHMAQVTSSAKDQFPDMSPNGRTIAFMRAVANVEIPQIFVINVDGTGETNLTNNISAACWSPTGPPPVWIPVPGCFFEVYPKWSPNGRKILFQSGPLPTDFDIWVMRPDGTHRTNLTNTPGTRADIFATWSPDGRRIAFSGGLGSLVAGDLANDNIYVMKSDGSRLRQVTANPERDLAPGWSPNGKKLVFWQETGPPAFLPIAIFSINVDGTNQRQLTDGPATYPSWRSNNNHNEYGDHDGHRRDGHE